MKFSLALFGPFSLAESTGSEIPVVSKKARALLAYLARTPGKPRSREEILALLWSDRAEAQGRASLRQVLAGLRKAAGEDLLLIDRDCVALNAAQVELLPPNGAEFLSGLHLKDPAFDDWLRDERLRLEDEPSDELDVGPEDVARKPSIVVLPFENLSRDPERKYFSDGIAEDIATELSRFGLINVIARKTIFELQEDTEVAATSSSGIVSDYRLEGSLRQAGNRIRLSARLIHCNDERQIWADRFDRNLDDLFTIQDELVEIIVTRIVGRIEVHVSDRALRKTPDNMAAYDYFLQGLWYDRRYDMQSLLAGRAVLQKAIELDPMFARAHSLLSTFMMCLSWTDEPTRNNPDETLAVAKRAVDLDPTDGACFSNLGVVHLDRGEHEAAQYCFDRALRLAPHDPYVWTQYAWLQNVLSKPDIALIYLDHALEADPHPPYWSWHIRGETLFMLERFTEAAAALERVGLEHANVLGQLASCYGHTGEFDRSSECWSKVQQLEPGTKLADIGAHFAYVRQEDADRWTEGLSKAGLRDPQD